MPVYLRAGRQRARRRSGVTWSSSTPAGRRRWLRALMYGSNTRSATSSDFSCCSVAWTGCRDPAAPGDPFPRPPGGEALEHAGGAGANPCGVVGRQGRDLIVQAFHARLAVPSGRPSLLLEHHAGVRVAPAHPAWRRGGAGAGGAGPAEPGRLLSRQHRAGDDEGRHDHGAAMESMAADLTASGRPHVRAATAPEMPSVPERWWRVARMRLSRWLGQSNHPQCARWPLVAYCVSCSIDDGNSRGTQRWQQ